MVPFTLGLLAGLLALPLPAAAVEITVSTTGGNKTNGHQYGFLHEVGCIVNRIPISLFIPIRESRAFAYQLTLLPRTSTTPVTAVSTPSSSATEPSRAAKGFPRTCPRGTQ